MLDEFKKHQLRLDLSKSSLESMKLELASYAKDDPEKTVLFKLIMETKYDWSKQYAQLVLLKARFGIVGDSWYKNEDPK